MTDTKHMKVENKLVTEKRAVSVYHHATRGAHLIGHGGSVTIPLESVEEEDYLHITVTRGPGRLENDSLLDIPWWMDFEIVSEGKVVITHRGSRVLVSIPPGPPLWQLKITRPRDLPPPGSQGRNASRIIVGEVVKAH